MNALVLAGLPILVGGGIMVLLLVLARIMPGDPKKVKADPPAAVTVPVRGPEYVQLAARRVTVYRRGVAVLLGLGVLTVIEFAVAQASGSIAPMFIIGLLKAALIVQYFMHIYLVWSQEEAH